MNEKAQPFKVRLKSALELRDMRAVDLCNKTKISQSTMSQYLSGYAEPKKNRLTLLADALNVNPTWLMGLDVPTERKSVPGSDQAFLIYLDSLGFNIYRDDPEHKPFMSSENISSCKLEYDTLDNLKLQIDSFTKATVDSELLALKEKELREERLEKERILQHLRKVNKKSVIQLPQEDKSSLDPVAARDRTDIEVTDEMKQNDEAIKEKVRTKHGK